MAVQPWDFALLIEAQERLDLRRHLSAADVGDRSMRVTITTRRVLAKLIMAKANSGLPSCANDDICGQRAAVLELETSLGKALDLAVALHLDFPVDNQLTGANVCKSARTHLH